MIDFIEKEIAKRQVVLNSKAEKLERVEQLRAEADNLAAEIEAAEAEVAEIDTAEIEADVATLKEILRTLRGEPEEAVESEPVVEPEADVTVEG